MGAFYILNYKIQVSHCKYSNASHFALFFENIGLEDKTPKLVAQTQILSSIGNSRTKPNIIFHNEINSISRIVKEKAKCQLSEPTLECTPHIQRNKMFPILSRFKHNTTVIHCLDSMKSMNLMWNSCVPLDLASTILHLN